MTFGGGELQQSCHWSCPRYRATYRLTTTVSTPKGKPDAMSIARHLATTAPQMIRRVLRQTSHSDHALPNRIGGPRLQSGSVADAQRNVTEGVEVVRQGDPVVPVGDVTTTMIRGDDEHRT